MTDQERHLTFAFCESVSASGRSPWHIRPLEKDRALKKSGGIDTDSLCAVVRAPYGWDLRPLAADWVKEGFICKTCRDRYEDYLRVGDLYHEHEGKKYVRMRDVEGLEKQLVGKLARISWYILTNPTLDRPFFLLEFEMQRRLHTNSSHWFRPEAFRLCIPQESVSDTFRQALRSQRCHAFSSTGTSSDRRAKPSVRKTTGASRR